jgi:transmembrane sensor
MENQEAKVLLEKYKHHNCRAEELALLESWYNKHELEDVSKLTEADWMTIDETYAPDVKTPYKLWPRIAGVAASVAAIVFGVWFYNHSAHTPRHPELVSGSPHANDIAPGKNTATLTLADGKVINLSDAKTGVVVGADKLAYNDGTVVDPSLHAPDPSLRGGTTRQPPFGDEIATARAELGSVSRRAPRNDGLGTDGKVQMMTANTPRGGTYQITLPDGTRVWLNADSKISFPAQFIGKERRILLVSGEAYFEVAKVTRPSLRGRKGASRGNLHERVPFIVESKGQEVEVLGTHFNISAYSDEISTKTTLLEGSVRVSSLRAPDPSLRGGTTRQSHDEVATARAELGSVSQRAPRNDDRGNDAHVKWEILKPGQQAVLTANANQIKVQQVDINNVIDWKNGDFIFTDEPIESIMRTVARWYDIDVFYTGQIKNERFTGTVSRNKNISEVLYMLEKAKGVHFKVEGKRVYVSN